jgi:hypothetical protein
MRLQIDKDSGKFARLRVAIGDFNPANGIAPLFTLNLLNKWMFFHHLKFKEISFQTTHFLYFCTLLSPAQVAKLVDAPS